ncbi:MAG: mechanosensitive ion channel family protein [Actinobacteria bacterium]|nr:mechanosensitive ion channel family protein [Actinomycetota bacterium]
MSEALLSAAYVIIEVAAIVLIAHIANRLGNRLVDRYVSLREKSGEPLTTELVAARKRSYTAAALLRHTLRYAIFGIAGYSIAISLFIKFPQLAAVLTGLGVAGVAVAFGAQAVLKDIIAGFFIVFENQYGIGDVVRIRLSGFEVFGIVEELSLRFTKVRDLAGNLRFIPNGGIQGVDRYASGYTTYRLELLLPPGDGREIKRAIERISDLYAGHPLLLGPIEIEQIVEGDAGHLVMMTTKAVPCEERLIERIGEAISAELVGALGLLTPPPVSWHEANEEALSLYERSVFVR